MNAKEELLIEVRQNPVVIKCAEIRCNDMTFCLRQGFNALGLEDFLNSLDFKYDSGYGGQELYGTVWLVDGTWLERREYDGSEWWEHKFCPQIPENLHPSLMLK